MAMRPATSAAVSTLLRSTVRVLPSSSPMVSSAGLASFSVGRASHASKRFTSTSASFSSKITTKPSVTQTVAASSAFVSSGTLIGAGAATTCILGPLFWGRAFGSFRTVAHFGIRSGNAYDIPTEREPLINSKELTFGAAMGLCSGYLFKKLGKMMMLVVGLGFVWLQLLASSGYIQVNWVKVEHKFKQQFDLDNDGKVTLNDAKHGFRAIIELLTRNFQFKSTFAGGFFLGFKYG
ncbi:hypothetical protein BG006_006216 [Podila minutissima]|uniref:FUN14 family protein n=1 Tax=Podila minutissima TaxID=64525 RepID=A0A9P5SJA8_9FUNG|nr:hypothetical protein BG006_006216 [Podila minutissima]